MNTIERNALTQGVDLYQELSATMDDRTLEILDRRRKTAKIRRRGWLVRRMLLVSDLIGLLTKEDIETFMSGEERSAHSAHAGAEHQDIDLAVPAHFGNQPAGPPAGENSVTSLPLGAA